MSHFPKLGILGGGQLGQMLIQSAINLGLDVAVLDPEEQCPCRGFCSKFTRGSLSDFETVYQFGKQVDVLTIEFEHVNTEALTRLHSEGIRVYPKPEAIALIQDKGLQKQFYLAHGIPTAPFRLIKNKKQLEKNLDFFPAIQKTRTDGYDGKGVCSLETALDMAQGFDAPSVLEKKVRIAKEFALSIARNPDGEVKLFPAVDLVFHKEAHLLDYLICPAELSEAQVQIAQNLASRIVHELDFIGLLAVEFFLCKNGDILVNEMAPRPHNSGHHTIEGTQTSQFEQVIRAVLNLPLGPTTITQPSAMINILGNKTLQLHKLLSEPNAHVHWYGKELKEWRKLGHVTVLAENTTTLKEKISTLKEFL